MRKPWSFKDLKARNRNDHSGHVHSVGVTPGQCGNIWKLEGECAGEVQSYKAARIDGQDFYNRDTLHPFERFKHGIKDAIQVRSEKDPRQIFITYLCDKHSAALAEVHPELELWRCNDPMQTAKPFDLSPAELLELFDKMSGHLADAWIVLAKLQSPGKKQLLEYHAVSHGDTERLTKITEEVTSGKTPIGVVGYQERDHLGAIQIQFQYQPFVWMEKEYIELASELLNTVGAELLEITCGGNQGTLH